MNSRTLDRATAKEALVSVIRRAAFGFVWIVAAGCLSSAGPFTAWPEWESRILKIGTLGVVFCVLVSVVYALSPLYSALADLLLRSWIDEDAPSNRSEEAVTDRTTVRKTGD